MHALKSCNVLVSTSFSLITFLGSGGLAFLCFHNACANGIAISEFDLYISVPNLRVVQVYDMW